MQVQHEHSDKPVNTQLHAFYCANVPDLYTRHVSDGQNQWTLESDYYQLAAALLNWLSGDEAQNDMQLVVSTFLRLFIFNRLNVLCVLRKVL